MIQALEYTAGDSCQPQFSHPRLVVEPHRGAPLMSAPGLGIVHELVERLGVASVIDDRVCVLRRRKWYTESDHTLTLAYNMLSGGDTLSDVNRLRGDDGLRRLLGTARIPHASTVGDFLARFDGKREGSSKRDQQAGKVALIELREAIEEIAAAAGEREAEDQPGAEAGSVDEGEAGSGDAEVPSDELELVSLKVRRA